MFGYGLRRPGTGILFFYKCALGPWLKMQGKRMRNTVVRLPEPAGARTGCAGEPGRPTLRLLFVGDSSAAGVGVEEQRFALAPQVAAKLAALRGSVVHWQLIAKTGATTASAMQLLDETPPERSDVLVLSLGTNDVTRQRSPKIFLRDYRLLVRRLQRDTGANFVVINGLPPIHILPAAPQPLRWYLGQYARRLDGELRRWVAASPAFRFVSLQWAAVPEDMAVDRYHPGPEQYRSWAQRIAECVHSQIQEDTFVREEQEAQLVASGAMKIPEQEMDWTISSIATDVAGRQS